MNWVDKIAREGEVAEQNWVVHRLQHESGQLDHMIFCPACQCGHGFKVNDGPGPIWGFNGDMVKPTLFPAGPGHTCSVRTNFYNYTLNKKMLCHFHINDGNIQYCDDCTHELAGQTRALEPF